MGNGASANVTIGVAPLGNLKFTSSNGYDYTYSNGNDYMRVSFGDNFSECWVTARFPAQGINISGGIPYTK
jgi:hypothetical protein